MENNFVMIKNVQTFTLLSFSGRVEMPEHVEGFFCSSKDKDAILPCAGYNSPHSPVEGLSKGPGGIPYFMPPLLKNSTL